MIRLKMSAVTNSRASNAPRLNLELPGFTCCLILHYVGCEYLAFLHPLVPVKKTVVIETFYGCPGHVKGVVGIVMCIQALAAKRQYIDQPLCPVVEHIQRCLLYTSDAADDN